MYDEIRRVFSRHDDFDDEVRVIVLAGRGPNSCAGNDLDEFATVRHRVVGADSRTAVRVGKRSQCDRAHRHEEWLRV